MGVFLPPCWLSFNNSETIKAVNLAFCSIKQFFIREIHVKFRITNFHSLQILVKTQTTLFSIAVFLFLCILYKNKIVITPKPVMILTGNFDQYLNLAREIQRRQKKMTMTSYRETITLLSLFQFMVNFEQSRIHYGCIIYKS